jgi:hypothetical protein
VRSTAWLVLAALTTLAVFLGLRAAAPQPWSYDEYYHLGIARLMAEQGPRLTTLPQTPFSVLGAAFVDKEPLFHLLLVPLAGLPLERAGLLAAMLGQVFVVGAFAFVLWRLRIPAAPWLLLALPALGTMFVLRAEMARPHVWLIGITLLYLGLLVADARPWVLALVAGLGGLLHTGGWIVIGFAALWAVAGRLTPRGSPDADRGFAWRLLPWTAGGWLAGQLVHPNVPANFGLLWLQNVVVPYQSTAGSAALRSQIGNELTPPEADVLMAQWPSFLAPLAVVALLLLVPRLRTRATLTTALLAIAFLVVGSVALRRFFELGAPLALLALGLVLRERQSAASGGGSRKRRDGPPARLSWLPFAGAVALGLLSTLTAVRALGFGQSSPPRAMAQWLGDRVAGDHAAVGDRVFTAQWADSAPLLYSAPRLESLVALDPTFFLAKDPALFDLYVQIVQGRSGDPARVIRERFGARWVTVWKQPVYRALAEQLATIAPIRYDDPDYLVFELPAAPG